MEFQEVKSNEKAIITMIVVFAFVIWPFGGVWQLLSGVIGGESRAAFDAGTQTRHFDLP